MYANELKRGMVIDLEGDLWQVLDYTLITPGNKRSILQTKLKNLRTGSTVEKRMRTNDRVEAAYFDKVEMEYLYEDQMGYVFMEPSGEQHTLDKELLKEHIGYVKPNTIVTVQIANGRPINVEIPNSVELKVTETDPAVRGQTATNQYKSAVLETGIKAQVPPFIGIGDVVRVDTRDGKYLDRASSK